MKTKAKRIRELEDENWRLRSAKLSNESYRALGFRVADLQREMDEMPIRSGADIDYREKIRKDKDEIIADSKRFFHEPNQYFRGRF